MKAKSILFIIILIIVSQVFCYSRGNKEIPEITVNTTGPQYLSPNEDEVQDTASFTFTVKIYVKSEEGYVPSYGIKITDSAGNMIIENVNNEKSDKNFFARLFGDYEEFTLDKEVTWDGKDEDGNIVTDGSYDSILWVKDSSGNITEESLEKFIVDIKAPEVTINIEHEYFSPNGDGNQDILTITHSESVELKWEGMIKDSSGNTIKISSWSNARPGEFIWDGNLSDGTLAPDAPYTYILTGTDNAGNTASFTVDTIVLDTRETPLTITLSQPYFSPNGDGKQDEVTIYPVIQDLDGLLSWQVSIIDVDGNTKKTFQGEGSDVQDEILYDGKDDSGTYLLEGEYQVSFEVKYIQGNNPIISTPLTADLLGPSFNVVIENPYFSPNGDGYGDVLLITMQATEEISWTGDVLDSDGTRIRNVGVEAPATEIAWDGMDNDGNIQPEAMYTLSLNIADRAGNWLEFNGGEMIIDFTPPESYISLTSTLFSPNGDGQKDTVGIEINTNEPVAGNCVVKDTNGNDVQYVSVFQDNTRVEWNGRDQTGQVVPDGMYTIEGVLSDLAGNNITTEAQSVATDTRSTKVSVNVPRGFSPNDDGIDDVLFMEITAELMEGIVNWNLTLEETPGVPSKSFSGGEDLPASLEWDGIDQMNLIREGNYTARLRVEYQKGDIAEGISHRFRLDVSPPEIALDVKSGSPEGVEDPLEEEVFITMEIVDDSEIKEWNLDIVNHEGEIIRSYGGDGDPSEEIAWNASGNNEKPVPPEDQYTIVVEVTDVHGNNNTFKQTLPLDLLIARIGDKYYLIVPNIIFGAYQYRLNSAGKEKYERNMASLKKAAEIYKKFPQYQVGLEAHALNIYLNKGDKAREKEEKRLVPLTKNRANTVKDALIKEGINKDRIENQWFGGKYPIISVEDKNIYWKNRRVEFLLIKPEPKEPEGNEETPGVDD